MEPPYAYPLRRIKNLIECALVCWVDRSALRKLRQTTKCIFSQFKYFGDAQINITEMKVMFRIENEEVVPWADFCLFEKYILRRVEIPSIS